MKNQEKNNQISPDLVRKVADKVYAIWLRDLEINRERRRPVWKRMPDNRKN